MSLCMSVAPRPLVGHCRRWSVVAVSCEHQHACDSCCAFAERRHGRFAGQRRYCVDMNQSETQDKSPSPAFAGSPIVPVIAGAIAIAIFIIDTATPLDIAIAVLYVLVVLMAANSFQRRGVLLVASTCLALTLLSYFMQHRLG